MNTRTAPSSSHRQMNKALLSSVIAGAFCLSVTIGCAKKKATPMNPAPSGAAQITASPIDVDARVTGATAAAQSLASRLDALPGKTTDDHVAAMRPIVSDLAAVLPMLKGQDQSGAYREQMETIRNAAAGLDTLPSGVTPEPYTDSALRASADVLADIAVSPDFASAGQAASVETLKKLLAELDRTHGPMHQLVVADAVNQVSDIVIALAAELEKQAKGESAAEAPAPAEAAPATPAAAPEPEMKPEAPAAEAPAPAAEAPAAEAPAAEPAAPAPAPEAPAPDAAAPAPEAPPAPAEELNK